MVCTFSWCVQTVLGVCPHCFLLCRTYFCRVCIVTWCAHDQAVFAVCLPALFPGICVSRLFLWFVHLVSWWGHSRSWSSNSSGFWPFSGTVLGLIQTGCPCPVGGHGQQSEHGFLLVLSKNLGTVPGHFSPMLPCDPSHQNGSRR